MNNDAFVTVSKEWVFQASCAGLERLREKRNKAIEDMSYFRPFKTIRKDNINFCYRANAVYFQDLIKITEASEVKQIHLTIKGYKILREAYERS